MSHPPQLRLSLVTSVHALLQFTRARPASFVVQTIAHVASLQTCPEAQVTPQPPQLFGSLRTFVHAPLHGIAPLAHWHLPPKHAAPLPQRVPHVPQLALSTAELTQPLPHGSSPVGQTHAPAEHVSPSPQTTPQPPQLFGSV